MRTVFLMSIIVAATLAVSAPRAAQTLALDYETFKTRVQPILLVKHEGFARCYTCHSQGTPFRLQRMSDGATTYNEEQSKLNFQAVQRLIKPGNPTVSRFLRMPLAHESGGTEYHPGGKRWESPENPEYQTIAAWIKGAR